MQFYCLVVYCLFGSMAISSLFALQVCFALAILFQPVVKISLGRFLWNVVDVIVGVWLIVDKE